MKPSARENKTAGFMIAMYCRNRHGGKGLCEKCRELAAYAEQRVAKCPFGEDKPACSQCHIHCYKPAMRAQIGEVMRYAGPKMIYRHPILAVRHLLIQQKKPARP